MSCFASASYDVLHNILSRLPAKAFASAACVSKCWNDVCGRIVSRPLLSSALSLNPCLHLAVREVLDKVLSKPIRPHFAIAFVGLQFSLQMVHHLIAKELGLNTPVITTAAGGIIGMDASTDELKEVKWDIVYPDESISGGRSSTNNLNRGIVLVVGYVPGLKVDIIPLLCPNKEPLVAMVDEFVTDVRNYTASVSGNTNPIGIMLFGDHRTDMKPIAAEIDSAMPEETIVVGDASSCFFWSSGGNSPYFDPNLYSFVAVGLVFARDKLSSQKGEIEFHVTVSTGAIPFGPQLEAVSVVEKEGQFSWLTARMEGELDILDGTGILESLEDEIDDEFHSLYIGVTKPRQSSGRYLAYYEVLGAEQDGFIVAGTGIHPGDKFLFYHSDSDTAASSCIHASGNLNNVKSSLATRRANRRYGTMSSQAEVFGGIIFACNGRGEQFFGQPNMDSMPFRENFPGTPVGGAFCLGEIGRPAVLDEEGGEEEEDVRCIMQVYSTVYLAMSYVPAGLRF